MAGSDEEDYDDDSSSGEYYTDSDEESSSSEEDRRPSYALVQLKSTEIGKAIKEGKDVATSRGETIIVEKNKYSYTDAPISTTAAASLPPEYSRTNSEDSQPANLKRGSSSGDFSEGSLTKQRQLKKGTSDDSEDKVQRKRAPSFQPPRRRKKKSYFSSFMSIFFTQEEEDWEEDQPLFTKVQLRSTQQGKILKEGRDIPPPSKQSEKSLPFKVQLRKSPGQIKKDVSPKQKSLPDEFNKVQLQRAPAPKKQQDYSTKLPQAFQEVKLKSSAIRWGKRFEVGTSEYSRRRARKAEQERLVYNNQAAQRRIKWKKSTFYRFCHSLGLLMALFVLAISSEHYYNHLYGRSELFILEVLEPICQDEQSSLPSEILVEACQVLPEVVRMLNPVVSPATEVDDEEETETTEPKGILKEDGFHRRLWPGRFMMKSKEADKQQVVHES